MLQCRVAHTELLAACGVTKALLCLLLLLLTLPSGPLNHEACLLLLPCCD